MSPVIKVDILRKRVLWSLQDILADKRIKPLNRLGKNIQFKIALDRLHWGKSGKDKD